MLKAKLLLNEDDVPLTRGMFKSEFKREFRKEFKREFHRELNKELDKRNYVTKDEMKEMFRQQTKTLIEILSKLPTKEEVRAMMKEEFRPRDWKLRNHETRIEQLEIRMSETKL